ncbi:MAG: hypothetical protein EZS28_027399 [Streblomastix strix]|uniref:Uncharacterized protein n=1 Tax=Streblomastix strix TaxID=222440 RepID=A0A5J4V373_9EUKA|nr:MAG: hypothetical protein EZS28_027399 [Streblomastix strix]
MQAEDFPVWVGLLQKPNPMMFDLDKHTPDTSNRTEQQINAQIRDESIRCMKASIVCRALHWGRNIFRTIIIRSEYSICRIENKQIIPLSEMILREQEKIRKQKLANVASWSSGKLVQNSIHFSPAFAGEYESMKERFMENLKIFLEHIFQVLLKYNSKQQTNLDDETTGAMNSFRRAFGMTTNPIDINKTRYSYIPIGKSYKTQR